ncbi:MAG: hypothetical protein K2K12_06250, partial [Clostridia bacterium]|nr:hypothetical protein [Clostridia bacterium]
FKVYFSDTGKGDDWQQVYHGESSQGARTDSIAPSEVRQVKYIKIEGIRRTTNYGYSIYEVSLYNLSS